MGKIALRYEMPFIDRVTMPTRWARWLSRQSQGNPALAAEPEVNGTVTWDYAKHGLAPWMQFFYDWRFADLTGDGQIDFILTNGARRQIAFAQDGTEIWRYDDPLPYDQGGAGFLDIRLDTNFPIYDIDGDGVPELVCARKVDGMLMLCLVDARTGEMIAQVPYPDTAYRPDDCRGSILVANLSGGRSTELIVSWDLAPYTRLDFEITSYAPSEYQDLVTPGDDLLFVSSQLVFRF